MNFKISLTENERILLSILVFLIVFWGMLKFFVFPQRDKIFMLNSTKDEYTDILDRRNGIFRREDKTEKELITLKENKDDIYRKYFPSLDQAQILYMLNNMIENSEVKINDISFSPYSKEKIEGITFDYVDISLPYEGYYDGLMEILKNIGTSSKKLVITGLTIDRADDDAVKGDIFLRAYSIEGNDDENKDFVYMEEPKNSYKEDPFKSDFNYEEIKNSEGLSDSLENTENSSGISGNSSYTYGSQEESGEQKANKKLLESFDDGEIYFMPSHVDIGGRISKSSNFKEGKYSLRLEYNILGSEKENRAFVDLTDENIKIDYPPDSVGMWVYSYGYSPVTVGIRFSTQDGEKIYTNISNGIGWTGWKYVEAKPPSDLKVYPLKIDRIYVELNENKNDYGVILIDELEANYPLNQGQSASEDKNTFIFYVVEKGDTLDKICDKTHSNRNRKNDILKYNEISGDQDLIPGKILVLPVQDGR